jgi:hypothetical protein
MRHAPAGKYKADAARRTWVELDFGIDVSQVGSDGSR